jgi:large subunit ribosomal protein L9
MNIILLKDVEKLGDKHTIVKVKPGFGRNFLIPQGLAIVANEPNKRQLNSLIKREDAKESKMLGTYQEMSSKIAGKTLKIQAKSGTSGKIFGSISSANLVSAIKDQFGFEIERKKIEVEEIKDLGTYAAKANLHKQVIADFNIEVTSSESAE